eukprot:COSAG02_NODE_1926_length_10341_cov_25.525776_8_plen_192_part_00
MKTSEKSTLPNVRNTHGSGWLMEIAAQSPWKPDTIHSTATSTDLSSNRATCDLLSPLNAKHSLFILPHNQTSSGTGYGSDIICSLEFTKQCVRSESTLLFSQAGWGINRIPRAGVYGARDRMWLRSRVPACSTGAPPAPRPAAANPRRCKRGVEAKVARSVACLAGEPQHFLPHPTTLLVRLVDSPACATV